MIEFAAPWLLLLLLLPLLVRRLIPAYRTERRALFAPFADTLATLTGQDGGAGAAILRRSSVQAGLYIIVWALIVLATARPQLLGEPIVRVVPTRDMLLAVDLSGSMDTNDFTNANGESISRLDAVKSVLDDFLERREGDRVGLILFGSAPFVQAPFTEDLDVCRRLLDEAQVGMAGPQTMLGDAIGLAINTFDSSEIEDRVLIVLTDGNDTGSRVPPDRAAEIARDRSIVIHTVAVGDPTAVGEELLDEVTLRRIASTTGGQYAHAESREELERVYRELDELDTRESETISHRPRQDLFVWPVGAALLLTIGFHLASGLPRLVRAIRIGADMDEGLHFLRPLWLLVIPAAIGLAMMLARIGDPRAPWRGLIAPHLLDALLIGESSRRRFPPHVMLAITLSVGAIAAAGPTWQRRPAPFGVSQSAMIFVIETTPSMEQKDIQPSRLERSAQKVSDLLELRKDTDAALIAYAGSAHLAMPLTTDASVIAYFAGALNPDIMPMPGAALDKAIAMANDQLREASRNGSIVLLTDGATGEQVDRIAEQGSVPVHVLVMASVLAEQEQAALERLARVTRGSLTPVSPDLSDVERVSAQAERRFGAAPSESDDDWVDTGYWLTFPLAALALVWSRRGWAVEYQGSASTTKTEGAT